jgi:methyl-accepting chemotaxis protein
MKQKLTEKSHTHAAKFWSSIDRNLFPAIERKDDSAARQAYMELTEAYQAHRAVIDEIVTDSEAMTKAVEATAAEQGTIATWSTGIVDVVVLMLLAFGIVTIIRNMVSPLVRITAVMRSMANGNSAETIPSTQRTTKLAKWPRPWSSSATPPLKRPGSSQQREISKCRPKRSGAPQPPS